MNDLISRKALLAEYDRVHIGEPGKARKLIEDASAVREWIPVSERLPETKTEVLVYTGTTIFSHTFSATDSMIQCGFTHWMPLPKMPKEG